MCTNQIQGLEEPDAHAREPASMSWGNCSGGQPAGIPSEKQQEALQASLYYIHGCGRIKSSGLPGNSATQSPISAN
jgi:hypothetical protein